MGRVVNATPRPLYPRERKAISIAQEARWAPGPVWTSRENLALTGFRSLDRPTRSESLYRLSYTGPPCQLLHTKQLNKLMTLKCAHDTECSGPIYADQLSIADSGPSVTVPSTAVTDGRTVGHGYPIMPSFPIFCAKHY